MTLAYRTSDTDWLERALRFIPGGAQTLSKQANKYVKGVYPTHLIRGNGCMVEDTTGRQFVDYISGLGPVILGYNHPSVTRDVKRAIDDGAVSMSLPHTLEVSLAELLANTIPFAEQSRFFKTGSDTLAAAVRVARAFTGKEKIAVCGYHGWHDWYSASTDRPGGIPKALQSLVVKFEYNNPQSLADCFQNDDIAAVVFEPVVYDEPKDDFIRNAVRIAHEHDALVIFDEVVTGFRWGLAGAAGYYGINPDLACYSKAMGNGYPIGALCGRKDLMAVFSRPDILISGTFGGEAVSIAAAISTIQALRGHDCAAIKKIWTLGKQLKDGFNLLAQHIGVEANCRGMAPRTDFVFPTIAHKALFWQEAVKAGILFGYANFVNAAHSTLTMDATLATVESSLRYVKEHWENPSGALEGELPDSPFIKR